METVIILARDHERLLAAARRVVGDWRANEKMAADTPMGEAGPQHIGWASLHELEHYVDRFTYTDQYQPRPS